MIKQILAMVLALGLMLPVGILPAPAQAAVVVGTGFAEETITVSTAAIGITAALCTVRGRQTAALVEVKTNAIYYTLDDPAATPDSGDYEAALGTVISIPKANYLRMIRQTADSSVKVTCFRGGQLPAESSVDKSGAGVSGSGVILTSFEYAEDVPHVSGDSGAFMLGVMNEDASTFGNIDDDYTGIATDRGWQQLVVPKYSTGVAAPLQLGKREDLPSAVSDAGMNVMVIRDDALIADAGTDNDLDYMSLRSDNFGALWGTLTDGAGGQLVQFEDGVAASGSPGIQALAVINSGFTTPAADSDYVPLQLSSGCFPSPRERPWRNSRKDNPRR